MRVWGSEIHVGITSVLRRYRVGAQRGAASRGVLGIFDKKEAGLSSKLEGMGC
ncbi:MULTISPECIES: hypothetical protein [Roseovarius]|uniref:Uncharacterized protein n=2 Tax=Roseovarius TaxID=74030 RepID=A0ABZ2HF22_9RHOB|nr:hypothetical protein [Roseovarius sp. W115]MDV2931103.1 hypothetical protein [Roseovarius sp. W115]